MVAIRPSEGENPTGGSDREYVRSRDDFHAWARHRWHHENVRRFPESFEVYDDVPRLFREFVLPGHRPSKPLLSPTDTVVTLGSCFAEELREVLQKAEFGSGLFWLPAGLNNTFALLDFVAWAATGDATPRAFRYERSDQGEIVEWSGGQEHAWYTEQFRSAGGFVFTLGLAEVWVDRVTDQVFWRGVPESIYDENRHEFRLTTPAENESNLREIIRLIRTVNTDAPILLTLSPVPLLATFRDISCMTADCVSKSVLRVALDNVMSGNPPGVYYWPSFELVRWAGASFDWRAYGQDARHVHRYLVHCIMSAFVECFYGEEATEQFHDRLRHGGYEVRAPHALRRSLTRFSRFRARVRRKVAHSLRPVAGGSGVR